MLAGSCSLRGPVSAFKAFPVLQTQLGLQHSSRLLSSSVQASERCVQRDVHCCSQPKSARKQTPAPQQTLSVNLADPSEHSVSVAENREYERAKNSAIGSLSLRPHSRKELVDKLSDKGYNEKAISRALDRLQELEVQSDADYAEVFARSKWRQSRWAPSRIQQELSRKGVGRDDCRSALEGLFGEALRGTFRVNLDHAEDGLSDEDSLCGTEDRVDQQLVGSARRQAEFTAGLPGEARKRRLVGWLQRRGHDWETIARVLALLKLK